MSGQRMQFTDLNKLMNADFLIVGAGIIGLTLARELLAQGADNIIILEKETALGMHASGRNSGVLHAGIYYPPNSLKAQLCLQGNLLLQQYCRQKKLPLQNSGKVIVTRNQAELPILKKLYSQALENGARVELIDENQLATVEPNAKTYQTALLSHDTAIVDGKAILTALQRELEESKKVKLLLSTPFLGLCDDFTAQTRQAKIRFKQFINAAGAYADVIAHQFSIGTKYRLIPFKGIYQKLIPEKSYLVKASIYPVPNLDNPFLGVHFTKNIHGEVYVGPTAIPALGRENYGIVRGIDKEMVRILLNELILFCVNTEFRKLACQEPKKYLSRFFYQDAQKIVKNLQPNWLISASKVGIRPQLVNLEEKKLLMDFVIINEGHTLHVLNAISPAFTSSMAFAKHLIQNYLSYTRSISVLGV